MSDFPNGRPPGQNNIDAGAEQYVPAENDPSATAQKPDEDRSEDDGIEPVEDDTDDETKQELREAGRNIVQPGSVEDNKRRREEEGEEPESQPRVQNVAPEPVKSPPADSNETKNTRPGAAASTAKK